MNITITWTAVNDANSIDQTPQYRLVGASSWTSEPNVAKDVATYTFTGLLDNELYEFRIINNCSSGGPVPSNPTPPYASLTCPVVTTTAETTDSLSYQFTPLGGDVNEYVIELRNDAGTVLIQTQTKQPPFSNPIVGTFSGLTASTSYKIKVIPKIKDGTTVIASKSDCGLLGTSTSSVSACLSPSNVSVSLT